MLAMMGIMMKTRRTVKRRKMVREATKKIKHQRARNRNRVRRTEADAVIAALDKPVHHI